MVNCCPGHSDDGGGLGPQPVVGMRVKMLMNTLANWTTHEPGPAALIHFHHSESHLVVL